MLNKEYPNPQLGALLTKLKHYHPNCDAQIVEKAYAFACKAHEGQFRKSGEAYFTHPFQVAMILADLMMDGSTIAAGLLHDCVEDCAGIDLALIAQEFGEDVALMVDGVTKLSRIVIPNREEQQAESLRKMFLAMAKDIRVVVIKLADRLHNMRTLEFQRKERQVPIAQETLDFYAPLAHRLGMSAIKWELEDRALRYIDPEGYYDLVEKVGMKREEREANIQKVIDVLKVKLKEMGIKNAEIDGRPKHFYSIYRKMREQQKTFDQIYDLIAIRIIVDTIPDCYAALGVVATLWTQIPNRFKDYISMPKPNNYQSLHTTVVGMGMSFEVQIRTWEMHRTSEFGIAAHWRYKEGKAVDSLDTKLSWLRQIVDWQNDARDPDEFMKALKVDLFPDEIFVFTPRGEVFNLPAGATPLDFAYRVHTQVGHNCSGAKVNGRIVPLDEKLRTGDFVEILTNPNSKGPSLDWLNIVKTNDAKAKIRNFFKHEFAEENMQKGKDALDRDARKQGYTWNQLSTPEFLDTVMRRYSISSLDDLYITVGFGGLSTKQVLNRLIDLYRKSSKGEPPPEATIPMTPEDIRKAKEEAQRKFNKSNHGIIAEGCPDDILVRFAKCCNPLPGDNIIGYITRGRGISIHRADCNNRQEFDKEPERLIEVRWADNYSESTAYNADIRIVCKDRVGLLADICSIFAKMGMSILSMTARLDKNQTTIFNVTIGCKSTEQLDKIIQQLLKRSDVIEVFRVSA